MIIYAGDNRLGSEFCNLTKKRYKNLSVEQNIVDEEDILYFIGTTHNYHVFNDVNLDITVNLNTLLNVLTKFKGSKRVFNFVSSWFVYGSTSLPAKESYCCKPKGFFSITKHAAEELLISYCRTFSIRYRIFRISNYYGGNPSRDLRKEDALQFLINQMKENRDISLYHDGLFYRDYLHIGDVCRAIDFCLEKAPCNEIINVGSGEKILFRDMINFAHSYLGSKSNINAIEPTEFHKIVQVKDFYMDISKLKNLGYRSNITIEKGIEKLCI